MPTEQQIRDALKSVRFPGYSRDIVSFGLLKEVSAQNGVVRISIQFTSSNPQAAQQIKLDAEQALRALSGVTAVHVDVKETAPAAAPTSPWSQQNAIPGIKHVVAVASGKGGVGKSTVSANLACALTHLGARVGRGRWRWRLSAPNAICKPVAVV